MILVMDTGSDAETAASLLATSDGAPTVTSATFNDPNSTYPHPLSLRSPIGIAQGEVHPEDDAAIRYVTALAGELRNLRISESQNLSGGSAPVLFQRNPP